MPTFLNVQDACFPEDSSDGMNNFSVTGTDLEKDPSRISKHVRTVKESRNSRPPLSKKLII